MRLNRFLAVLFVLALCSSAEAQQPKKVPTVGFLALGSASSDSPNREAFRHGLAQLGLRRGTEYQHRVPIC